LDMWLFDMLLYRVMMMDLRVLEFHFGLGCSIA
jgi:hypothetical protein